MLDLGQLRPVALDRDMAEQIESLEQFVNIALHVFATTNPSKLREAMRLVEIRALMRPSQLKPDADA